MAKKSDVTLSELIDALRADLEESAAEREETFEPMFEVKEATVELEVSVTKEKGVDGKVNVYLANIGAKGTQTTGQTQKLTVTLVPSPGKGDGRKSPTMRGAGKRKRRKG